MAAPVLYIIHGWTYTVEPWATTLALLKKASIPVRMLHVPGLTEESRKVFTIEDYVAWANKNLPDGAIALGHSNGGRILLNLCAEHPEKLRHLILLDAAGAYEELPRSKQLIQKIAKLGAPLKKSPLIRKVFHKLTGTSDYAHAPENMKETLTNMLASDKDLNLEKVTTPTSIIWGGSDTITPPHQAKIIHDKLPNSTLDMHARWDHAPYISHPSELATAIKKAYLKAIK